jgi:hypothetical protein
VQTTGLAPVHVPVWHVSVCVQPLLSLHPVPLVSAGFEHTPVAGVHVPVPWHWSKGLQTTGFAPVHTPVWQVSLCVQEFESLHTVPFALFGFEQAPVAGAHVPATWHWSSAVQATGFAPVQVPAWQVSLCVHALASLHATPLALFGFEHVPVAGAQVPAVWHWSSAAQATGLAPVQAPAWQVSVCVQALASLHATPLALAGFEHTPVAGAQEPALWH